MGQSERRGLGLTGEVGEPGSGAQAGTRLLYIPMWYLREAAD